MNLSGRCATSMDFSYSGTKDGVYIFLKSDCSPDRYLFDLPPCLSTGRGGFCRL